MGTRNGLPDRLRWCQWVGDELIQARTRICRGRGAVVRWGEDGRSGVPSVGGAKTTATEQRARVDAGDGSIGGNIARLEVLVAVQRLIRATSRDRPSTALF